MTHRDYLDFLLEKKHHPASFSYGISNRVGKDENGKLKSFDDEELCYFEIGYMYNAPIKMEVKEKYSRSVIFNVHIFDIVKEIQIYCHLGMTPDEFYRRCENGLWKLFATTKEGDDDWEKFKTPHDTNKKKLHNAIGGAFNKAFKKKEDGTV